MRLGRSFAQGLALVIAAHSTALAPRSPAHSDNGTACATRAEPPVAATWNGTVIGLHNEDYNQDLFLGIPYAQPLVGGLRFHQPQPVNESWNRRPTRAFGDWCMQAPLSLVGFSRPGYTQSESEDCLTINIVRPSGVDEYSRLPVLVWIYGGGLQEGGSADQRYNSSFIVQQSVTINKPIVHVTLNYRLSGFGFLSGQEILDETLRWIQENIAAFGGDPSHVTISGESSGAQSVGTHYLAYSGRDDGLFQAGICESAGPLESSAFVGAEMQDEMYGRVVNLTGCQGANDTLACLRTVPAEDLRGIFQGRSYFPVIDGELITDLSANLISASKFIKRPLLIGSNTNEGTVFTLQGRTGISTSAQFAEVVSGQDAAQNLSTASRDLIVSAYVDDLSDTEVQDSLGSVDPTPSTIFGSLYGRVSLFMGDWQFFAGQRLVSQSWARAGVPVYGYRFDATPNGFDPEILGATHFTEIGFVFKNLEGLGWPVNPLASNNTVLRQQYVNLAKTMSSMWVSFASTYNPNLSQDNTCNATWPVYRNGDPKNIVFHLNGTYSEQDNKRVYAIQTLIDTAAEFQRK